MSDAGISDLRPLTAAVVDADARLVAISEEIDWLRWLSPIHNDALWETFRESGYRSVPALEYDDPAFDPDDLADRLDRVPIDEIEHTVLQALIAEKQQELRGQLRLVEMRNEPGFRLVSRELFGGADPLLLELAQNLLTNVPVEPPLVCDARVGTVVEAAELEISRYRESCPDFQPQVIVDQDLNSLLMVARGNLHVAASIELPSDRIDALLAHEIGTHAVTYFNGRNQPLKLLACGLAGYDALQEGLGVLAEYLAGNLDAQRLRVIAARVVATDMAQADAAIPEIFDCLHGAHGLPAAYAFDVAVRAARGGGLTKDVVYLRGLNELLGALRSGIDLARFYPGKFALTHFSQLEQLIAEGCLGEARLLPRFITEPGASGRLASLRRLTIEGLCEQEPRAGTRRAAAQGEG